MLTRRFFIGGLASVFALGPRRIFSAPAAATGAALLGKPALSFGVLSDVHVSLTVGGGRLSPKYDTRTLELAFTWFRDQGADAVVIAGDIAHCGLAGELKAVAETWYKVFPNDRAPDGRRVERVFVFGNHDWADSPRAKHVFPDEKVKNANLLVANPKKWWDEFFHEEWTPFFEKTVNGYPFIGAHWCNEGCKGRDEKFTKGLKEYYAARKTPFDPAKPFFHVQHPHPRATVHGERVWGQDDGVSSAVLSAYPNAIAFSGHSHVSLTDERSVWQGAFTSIGCASLRNVAPSVPGVVSVPYGYENGRAPKSKAKAKQEINALRAMAALDMMNCRQGQFVRVFADSVVISRREFVTGAALCDDLVMPLPAAEKRPFEFAPRAARAKPPAFPPGSKLTVRRLVGKLRGKGKNGKRRKTDVWEMKIPAATAEPSARVWAYEITATSNGGGTHTFAMTARGGRFPTADARVSEVSAFRLACERLPPGGGIFAVRAVSCWGKKSEPLAIAFT